MKRRAERSNKRSVIFKNTARKVKAINLAPSTMRGGTRLA